MVALEFTTIAEGEYKVNKDKYQISVKEAKFGDNVVCQTLVYVNGMFVSLATQIIRNG